MNAITHRRSTLSLASALGARGQPSEDMTALSLTEAASRIRVVTVTATQLTEACLARIETYNPKLKAFIKVTHEQATERHTRQPPITPDTPVPALAVTDEDVG